MEELNRGLWVSPLVFRMETRHASKEAASEAIDNYKSIEKFMKQPRKFKNTYYGVSKRGDDWTATIQIEKYEYNSTGSTGI